MAKFKDTIGALSAADLAVHINESGKGSLFFDVLNKGNVINSFDSDSSPTFDVSTEAELEALGVTLIAIDKKYKFLALKFAPTMSVFETAMAVSLLENLDVNGLVDRPGRMDKSKEAYPCRRKNIS